MVTITPRLRPSAQNDMWAARSSTGVLTITPRRRRVLKMTLGRVRSILELHLYMCLLHMYTHTSTDHAHAYKNFIFELCHWRSAIPQRPHLNIEQVFWKCDNVSECTPIPRGCNVEGQNSETSSIFLLPSTLLTLLAPFAVPPTPNFQSFCRM